MNLYTSKLYQSDLRVAASHAVGLEQLWNKTVLITGATGTIGSFAVDTLLAYSMEKNAQITVILAGRNVQRLEERFGVYPGAVCVFYDMNEPISFDMPVDYVIHAAGNAHPTAFNSDPVGTMVGNLDSTKRLLDYGVQHGMKRFLYVSSGEVYGLSQEGQEEFLEDYAGYVDILSPRSCYPLSKRAAENLCASYAKQYNVEIVCVRPCHTYGPEITPSDSRAHVQFMRNVLAGQEIEMKSTGSQVRSYSYAADCISGLLTVLTSGKSGEAYNLSNRDSIISIAGLAETIAKAGGSKVVFHIPNAAEVANRSPFARQVLGDQKLRDLGWCGAYTVEEGVMHTLRILNGE